MWTGRLHTSKSTYSLVAYVCCSDDVLVGKWSRLIPLSNFQTFKTEMVVHVRSEPPEKRLNTGSCRPWPLGKGSWSGSSTATRVRLSTASALKPRSSLRYWFTCLVGTITLKTSECQTIQPTHTYSTYRMASTNKLGKPSTTLHSIAFQPGHKKKFIENVDESTC